MALRRLFSCLLLTFGLFGADSASLNAYVAPAPDTETITLRAGDRAVPSPFLGGVAQADAERVGSSCLRSTGRAPARTAGRADPRTVPADPGTPSRVRASHIALLDVVTDLTRTRTGVRSARATALPPPTDS